MRFDHELLVSEEAKRDWVFPQWGKSPGYVPGAIVIDGEIAGVWQRQQRKVTIHPWRPLPREEIEREALSLPIASKQKAAVRWEPAG